MTQNEQLEGQTNIEDFLSEGKEAPAYSLLKVWSSVLGDIESVRDEPIPMNVSHKIVVSWPQLTYQDTEHYHRLYHGLLMEVRSILQDVIEENPGSLDHEGDADVEHNTGLYRELVVAWNILLDQYESEWRAEAEDSHIQLAAVVDARAFLFSRNGFAGHLEHRGITFSSEDIFEEIRAAREEQSE